MPTLSQIILYPLKSARGACVESGQLNSSGLSGDRQWMLVTPDGECVSQLVAHSLSTVVCTMQPDGIRLEAKGHSPLDLSKQPRGERTTRQVIMEDGTDCQAEVAGTEYDQWFSSVLGMECHLVLCPRELNRRVEGEGELFRFQKTFPIHLATEASLDELNGRLEQKVSMDRFRPNLVLSGTAPFEDDQWKRIQIGEAVLQFSRACDHGCGLSNIHQETGVMGPEPLRTLATYRRANRGIYFGQNVTVEVPGQINVGDEVVILEYGEGLTDRVSKGTENPRP